MRGKPTMKVNYFLNRKPWPFHIVLYVYLRVINPSYVMYVFQYPLLKFFECLSCSPRIFFEESVRTCSFKGVRRDNHGHDENLMAFYSTRNPAIQAARVKKEDAEKYQVEVSRWIYIGRAGGVYACLWTMSPLVCIVKKKTSLRCWLWLHDCMYLNDSKCFMLVLCFLSYEMLNWLWTTCFRVCECWQPPRHHCT